MARTKKIVEQAEVIEQLAAAEGVTVEVAGEIEQAAKPLGIGSFIKEYIRTTECTNNQILEMVKLQYPNAKTSYACIAWYRTQLRKAGEIGPRVFAKKPADEAENVVC